MAFDLSTAQPIQPETGGFDLSTAQPVESQPVSDVQPTRKPMGQLVQEKMGPPKTLMEEPQKSTLGQKWMINMLDNPLVKTFIRQVAPSQEEADRAIQEIETQGSAFRKGVGETALTVGTGMVAEPTAGLAGLAVAPFAGAEEATKTIESLREGMTYQPRTETGQEMLGAVAETMAPVGEAIQATEEAIGEAGYEAGGPLLGAMGEALPTAVMSAIGLKAARRPTTKLKQRLVEDLKQASAQPELARSIKTATETVNPNQLPAVIKGMERDIVSRSGKRSFDELASLADDAARGDVDAIRKISETADNIGQVRAEKGLAKYILSGSNKVKGDPLAKEAIKQGFEPGVVTAVKGASKADNAKMLKMTEIMRRGKKDARYGRMHRPADVAGDSLLERFKYVKTTNKQAADQLDNVAKNLRGQKVDFEQPIQNFADNLDEMGVSIGDDLQPIFKGSDIEGLSGPEGAVRNMIKRLASGERGRAPDAYELHRLKKYIDENVTYGKAGEGLKGRTESIMKQLRHDIDKVLDDNFPEYNAVNTQYAETRGAIDALQEVAGKKMNLTGPNADKAAGTLLRRLMSNAQSRVNLIDATDMIDKTARNYGAVFDDDILTQMMFADELDSVFGPVAKTSLAGEETKALKAAARATTKPGAADIALEAVGKGIGKMRGIDEEGAFNSIESLLKRSIPE